MDLRAAIREAIEACGGVVTLQENEKIFRFAACIQPVVYGAQGQVECTRFGTVQPMQFVYYGPLINGGERVKKGALLMQGSHAYRVVLCQDFCWKGKAVFRWAALIRQEDAIGTVDEDSTRCGGLS